MISEQILVTARQLAYALMKFAHDRSPDDRKNIAQLQGQLCKLVRDEEDEDDPHRV